MLSMGRATPRASAAISRLIPRKPPSHRVISTAALILPLRTGGETLMPRAFAWLMLTFMIGGVRPLSADDRDDTELPVTIQIHDYSHVSSGSLTRARAVVTAMYERIGVRTEWMGVVQQHVGGEKRPSRRDEIQRHRRGEQRDEARAKDQGERPIRPRQAQPRSFARGRSHSSLPARNSTAPSRTRADDVARVSRWTRCTRRRCRRRTAAPRR